MDDLDEELRRMNEVIDIIRTWKTIAPEIYAILLWMEKESALLHEQIKQRNKDG